MRLADDRSLYRRGLERLYARARFGMRMGLAPVRCALARAGDPQRRYRVVHVAGTNGKGSVAAMIERAARAAGVRTGLFTSPHLCRFTERIRVDGAEIDAEELGGLLERIADDDPELTFFELATVAALCAFAARGVELVVLETGLGGRLDATNVVDDPDVVVITSIGMDHAEALGPTLAGIAREKAGIIKSGCDAIALALERPEQAAVQREIAAAGLHAGVARLTWVHGSTGASAQPEQPLLGLAGPHQRDNAELAVAALRALAARGLSQIDERAIGVGLSTVRWPGRLERIDGVWLDCAHNVDAARALARALRELAIHPLVLLFGHLADKPTEGLLEPLLPLCAELVAVRPRSDRAADPTAARDAARRAGVSAEIAADVPSALARARRSAAAAPSRHVLVAGSVYLVGEARALLSGEPVDPLPLSDPHKVSPAATWR